MNTDRGQPAPGPQRIFMKPRAAVFLFAALSRDTRHPKPISETNHTKKNSGRIGSRAVGFSGWGVEGEAQFERGHPKQWQAGKVVLRISQEKIWGRFAGLRAGDQVAHWQTKARRYHALRAYNPTGGDRSTQKRIQR